MVIAGYTIDAAGGGAAPWVALAIATVLVAALAAVDARIEWRPGADLFIWIGVCAFVVLALLGAAWPTLVPPGRGPDLTHHLLLVDYIEQHGHLVHDRSLDGSMGEMAHYTPGAHLLAVFAGRWSGVDAIRAFYPLLVVCAALTAGFVFLIARRLLLPVPYALAAVALLFLPAQYFSGAFTHDGFLAQAVATCFAVASWWALVAFDEERSTTGAAVIGVLLAAAFLTWPIWIGPPVVVFVALALTANDPPKPGRRRTTWGRRMAMMPILALAPLLLVAGIHVVGRWGWLVIVRTSGAVLEPGLASLGWLLPLLAIAGVIVTARDRRARVTIVLILVILLQALTLFAIAKSQGATTPYLAFKMMYLAIYPAAVLAAAAIATLERDSKGAPLGWILAAILVAIAVRPVLIAPRVVPVVDVDLYEAGKWTRANVGQACVDYLVADAETAYWLHLAVLGNPRASARMIEIDRYDPRSAMAPWIASEGRSFAIADTRLLPDEVRSRVAVVAQYGSAAVIRRRDATMKGCD